MIALGPLSFAVPAALVALLALPALWWLLRVLPPAPLRVRFPPVRLLARLAPTEQSVRRTPPWLLALRLALAAAIILGLARPLLNAATPLPGSGSVILIVDNGWASAPLWSAQQERLAVLLDRADREDRQVILAPTAPDPGEAKPPLPRVLSAGEAREAVRRMEPRPWPTDRVTAVDGVLSVVTARSRPPGAVIWLSDGTETPPGDPRGTRAAAPEAGGSGARGTMAALSADLAPFGAVTVTVPDTGAIAAVLRPPVLEGERLTVGASRAASQPGAATWVRALADDGAVLARQPLSLTPGEHTSGSARSRAVATFVLPTELRNRIARLELETGQSAAGVVLLDERWRRRPVGIVSARGVGGDLPLLSDSYYLARALEGFAEVRRGTVASLLGRELAVLVLIDTGLSADERRQVQAWVEQGGVLLRFAGPLLASGADHDDILLPTPLRPGDRILGGSIAWREPARLAPFGSDSPFAGLKVPDDVEIERQVLAQPSLELERNTWARLDDGTPLVTAARRGDGWVVLFHTTANADWSTLPLSGLFVAMLERIVGLSRGAVAAAGGPPLKPAATVDGFGRLGAPPVTAQAIATDAFAETRVGPTHPPGLYGEESRRRALNLSSFLPEPVAIGPLPGQITRTGYQGEAETDLRPWLLGAALILALIDLSASMALRGLVPSVRTSRWQRGRRGGYGRATSGMMVLVLAANAGAAIAFAPMAAIPPARAQTIVADGSAIPETLTTRLAYVRTGRAEVDEASRAGLAGLSMVVSRRTAVELGEPVGVEPGRDELVFYPFIYWPVIAGAALPSADAARALRDYMANGGTIVFDTRSRGAAGDGSELRELARVLDIPPLTPVPSDHVLARAYYLLSEFPGRWHGQVWVERAGERVNDGVTSAVAGSNDWAGAWAVDEFQRPMFPVVPGGDRQREQAYRFGINLLMHVLTGNYKADQVHLPAILERLGK